MLVKKIMAVYPSLSKADFGMRGTISIRDDGEGEYIGRWASLLQQPTQEQLDAITVDPNAPEVPQVVTPRQVRLLLLSQGLLDEVEAMIAEQDRAVRLTWEYALEFHRDDPLLTGLAATLGLTEAQIDDFFIAAAQL